MKKALIVSLVVACFGLLAGGCGSGESAGSTDAPLKVEGTPNPDVPVAGPANGGGAGTAGTAGAPSAATDPVSK